MSNDRNRGLGPWWCRQHLFKGEGRVDFGLYFAVPDLMNSQGVPAHGFVTRRPVSIRGSHPCIPKGENLL
jgi:hypothetical protein